MLGIASASAVAIVAYIWQRNFRVAFCLFGGIGGGMTAAAILGVAMPNMLRMFRRNPQVAAGPIALACADMVTLVAYFSLARWIT
jgi:magnesium transporter